MFLYRSIILRCSTMFILPCVLLVTACGGGGEGPGTLSLTIADAPMDDAQNVVVEFTAVELKPANGSSIMIPFVTPMQIDLMRLTGGVTETLFNGQAMTPGQYSWLRLHVNADANVRDSYIMINGAEFELRIPSGAETSLKINSGFTVPASGTVTYTIDFDLRKSVRQPGTPGDDYLLRPVLRMVDNSRMGMMSGAVDAGLVSTYCGPDDVAAVYVFEASVTQPDDIDGIEPEPVTTARVPMDGQYAYTVPFLDPGSYMVAFTCDAAMDQPDSNDTGMVFHGITTINVGTGQTMMHQFMP